MGGIMKYLPDLTKPKNEIYTILMFFAAALSLIAQWLGDAGVTTEDGLTAALVAGLALIGRLKTFGQETVAEIHEEYAREDV